MKRRLRLLLAFLLVPVVLFGNPQTATAASEWEQITITPDIPSYPDDIDCTLNLQTADDGVSLNVGGNSYCGGAIDTSPGESQWGESGADFAITFSGTDLSGNACGGNGGGVLTEHSASSLFYVAGGFQAQTIPGASAEVMCTITEVCLFLIGNGGSQAEGCQAVDIEPVIPEEAQCPFGDASAIELEWFYKKREGVAIWDYWWDIKVFFTNTDYVDWTKWRVTRQTAYHSDFAKQGVSFANGLAFSQAMNGSTHSPGSQGEVDLRQAMKPRGVQIYALDQVRNTGTAGYDPSSASLANVYPPQMPDGAYRGLTQPSVCRFYFGEKVVDFPDTDADEPSGPLYDVPYIPPSPTGGPEPTVDPVEVIPEPVDSEGGFWTLVGGLLRLILGAIKALGSAIAGIADAILDGLRGLFVPDEGFMDGRFRDLKQSWQDTTPAQYVDALDGMAAGSASGCGGLPLQLTLPGGVQVDESIGAACSGTMANVAGIVRMVLSAGLVIGGTFACVRALGSGFGWNPGVGSRADV